jgi:hypothetical protein
MLNVFMLRVHVRVPYVSLYFSYHFYIVLYKMGPKTINASDFLAKLIHTTCDCDSVLARMTSHHANRAIMTNTPTVFNPSRKETWSENFRLFYDAKGRLTLPKDSMANVSTPSI